MRLTAASAFLQSRVGRQLFGAVFVLLVVPVAAISLLAYQLTDYIVRQSAVQLSNELSKSVGLNLIDRIVSAESLLRVYAQSASEGVVPKALSERLALVFSSADLAPAQADSVSIGPLSVLRVTNSQAQDKSPVVDLEVFAGPLTVRGTFKPEYVWENAQSGTHRLCFSGVAFAEPFCQGVESGGASAIVTTREIFFQPYFQAPAWTVTASLESKLATYLPVGIAALVGNVAGITFLLAVFGSSVLLRKLTRPLDALTSGTRAVLRGDFSREVRIAGTRSEFTDLADSFNTMAKEVGRDLLLFRRLAQIDAAIMEQRPFEDVLHLTLAHLDASAFGGQISVLQCKHGALHPWAFSLGRDGALEKSLVAAPQLDGFPVLQGSSADAGIHHVDLPIAQTELQRVWLRVAQLPNASDRSERELNSFRQRLAVALHAEQREYQLHERATRDSLTGLLNRLGIVEAIDQLARTGGGNRTGNTSRFAVVCMDLDGFKEINDAYGHDAGDRVLQEVARRLLDCLGDNALAVARPGGDEFVFLVHSDQHDSFRRHIDSVMQSMRQPFLASPRTLQLAASFGLALFPEDGQAHDELLKHADLAMYSAKNAGRNTLVQFDHALKEALTERLALRRDLREALRREQVFVVFQPRVDSASRQLVSVEALLRWRHPDRGLISPDVFIPLAEETGVIFELGRWVLREALRQFQQWRTDPHHPVRHLSVNLSPLQLADGALPTDLQGMLQEFGIHPGELELEITEGALIRDVDAAVERLSVLRDLGVAIALDDFGVGYSTMSYLSRLPFDTLKIDKSFVAVFGVERPALAIATAIVALAKALDKRVVAEGVEMLSQAQILETLGVDELQGYLYGKPQTAAEIDKSWVSAPRQY